MNDLNKIITGLGFDDVIVTDAEPFGQGEGSLILAVWRYEGSAANTGDEAVVHPYYPASQRAYLAAREVCRITGLRLRNDIPLKPVLSRIGRFCRGMNTLSYLPVYGSRFHLQTFVSAERAEPTDPVGNGEQINICSGCGRCLQACPTGAITPGGFVRTKCLREWMLSGKSAPPEIRMKMGNRLIGCDECERVCPMNAEPVAPATVIPLRELLRGDHTVLPEMIGHNLAVPNRVLIQCCAIAGSLGRKDLINELQALRKHPSERVREAAGRAVDDIIYLAKDGQKTYNK